MTGATEVLVALAMIAAGAYVTRPLLRSRRGRLAEGAASEAAELDKDAALRTLLDLEEDEAAGKVTAEDAAELRPHAERAALEAVDAARAAAVAAAADDEIEAEVAEATRALTCPRCGRVGEGSACTQCGGQLT